MFFITQQNETLLIRAQSWNIFEYDNLSSILICRSGLGGIGGHIYSYHFEAKGAKITGQKSLKWIQNILYGVWITILKSKWGGALGATRTSYPPTKYSPHLPHMVPALFKLQYPPMILLSNSAFAQWNFCPSCIWKQLGSLHVAVNAIFQSLIAVAFKTWSTESESIDKCSSE